VLGRYDLRPFFESLPDRVVVLKYPTAGFFVEDIQKQTDREVRVVYCLRNPLDNLISMSQKRDKPVEYFLLRSAGMYDEIAGFPRVFPVLTEQLLLKNEFVAGELLKYCSLSTESINFAGLEPPKKKKGFLNYRVTNFIIKRLKWIV
jgi:hypothetical protein